MTKEHERAQASGRARMIKGLGEPRARGWIEPVLDERAVEADEHNVARRSTVMVAEGPSGTSTSVVSGAGAGVWLCA